MGLLARRLGRALNEGGEEGTTDGSKVEVEFSHPQDAIAFIVTAIGFGILVLFVTNLRGALKHHLKVFLPFTVLCFLGAFVLEVLERTVGLGSFLGSSVRQWIGTNPELILFVFLPALLFNDAMSIDIHLWSKKFLQAFTMAVPGVLIGTFVTALFVTLIMPDWPWLFCVLLGAILSATDPVAVVALLKSLGAPKELTMIIMGESLLNDGVAYVLFLLIFDFYLAEVSEQEGIVPPLGESRNAGAVAAFFAQEAIAGPLIGIAFGIACLVVLNRTKHGELEDHHTAQLAATIATAYASYYVADRVCHSSGVLACVSAALVVAYRGWPIFTDVNTIKHVWHSAEFFANTVIFAYAGLVASSAIFIANGAQLLGKGILLYVVVMVVRLFTVVVLYPFLWYLDRKDPIATLEDVLGFGDGMGFAHEDIEHSREHQPPAKLPRTESQSSRDVPSRGPGAARTVSERHLIGTKKLLDFSVEAFYPSFRAIGWRDLLLITWGGLRGAVGLVLALVVYEELLGISEAAEEVENVDLEEQKRLGEEILVLYVAVCLLTLIVNAPTTPALVNFLGLKPKQSAIERIFLQRVVAKLHEESKKDYKKMVAHYVLPPSWSRTEREYLRNERAREEHEFVEDARKAFGTHPFQSMPTMPTGTDEDTHGAHGGIASFLTGIHPDRMSNAGVPMHRSMRQSMSFHNPRQREMCEAMYDRSLNWMVSELVERKKVAMAEKEGGQGHTRRRSRSSDRSSDDGRSPVLSEDGTDIDIRWKTSEKSLRPPLRKQRSRESQNSDTSFGSLIDEKVVSPMGHPGHGHSFDESLEETKKSPRPRRSSSERTISFRAHNADFTSQHHVPRPSYSSKDVLDSSGDRKASALRSDPRYNLELDDSEADREDTSETGVPREDSGNIFIRDDPTRSLDAKNASTLRSRAKAAEKGKRNFSGSRSEVAKDGRPGIPRTSSSQGRHSSQSWTVPKFDEVLTVFGWDEDGATDVDMREVDRQQRELLQETMSIIDEELEVEGLDKFIRDVFLHLVRAKYWDLINAEILPRGEASTQILLHSVDHALDFTTDGLFDFDYFHFKIGKKDFGSWMLTQLDFTWRILFGGITVTDKELANQRDVLERSHAQDRLAAARSRGRFFNHRKGGDSDANGGAFQSDNNITAFTSMRDLEIGVEGEEKAALEAELEAQKLDANPGVHAATPSRLRSVLMRNTSSQRHKARQDPPKIRYLSKLLNTMSNAWTTSENEECASYSRENLEKLEGLLRKPVNAKYPHLANSSSCCLHSIVVKLRTLEAAHQADRYFGINAFVRAHIAAQEEILKYFGQSDAVTEHLQATIIRESKRSVAAAKKFLDTTIDPHVIIRERWIQLAEIAMTAKRRHLYELHNQGMITEANLEDLDENLREKLDDLRVMRHNIDRIFAQREEEEETKELEKHKEVQASYAYNFKRFLDRTTDSIFGAAAFGGAKDETRRAESMESTRESQGLSRVVGEGASESKGPHDVEVAMMTEE